MALPRLRRLGRSIRHLPSLLVVAAVLGCGGAAREPPAPPTLPLTAGASAAPSASPPAVEGAALDLTITFHPDVSGNLGWFRPEQEISLDLLGGAGRRWVDGVPWTPSTDPLLARLEHESFLARLSAGGLSDTSVIVDERLLCSPEVRAIVARDQPSRLLLAVAGGITPKAVACLRELPAPRLYLTGCLYRSHRPGDACDGDAELAALAADEALRPRVRGLALSLGSQSSMEALGRFAELELLALAPARSPEPGVGVEALPFAALPKLRYLDLTTWTDGERVFTPAALRAIAGLHTLRWAAHLAGPIPAPCNLARYRSESLGDADVEGLAACSALRELSSDEARFDSAEPLRRFPALERLHLRHWKASDLAPLASLRGLRDLSLTACKAADYGVLGDLPALRRVDLSQSELSDLAIFASLPLLEELDVGFTKVPDLAPLRGLTRLTLLELNDTQVTELAPIAPLRALRKLTFSNTGVRRLQPLAGNPSLEWVILYGTQVTDASPLFTLPKLRRAHIGGLSLPGEQVERLRKALGSELND